jgi:protein-histidine N-methyltransferase
VRRRVGSSIDRSKKKLNRHARGTVTSIEEHTYTGISHIVAIVCLSVCLFVFVCICVRVCCSDRVLFRFSVSLSVSLCLSLSLSLCLSVALLHPFPHLHTLTSHCPMGKPKGRHAAPAREKKQSLGVLKAQADKHFVHQDYRNAIQLYSEAIKHNSAAPYLYSNRSAAYILLKDYASSDSKKNAWPPMNFVRALKDAQECIRLRPEWAKGYLRQGYAFEKMLKYGEALAAYRQGLKSASKSKASDLQPLRDAESRLCARLDELKLTDRQISTTKSPDQDEFSRMVEWMAQGNARHPMLYLRYYSQDYRGVHVLCKIPSYTEILYVPHSHVMTSEKAKASPIGQRIISSKCPITSKHSYLAAFLLEEKHKDGESFWKPYLDILPSKYRNMPIFFTDKELEWLKGSFTYQRVYERRKILRTEYEIICKSVPEFRHFTHWEFVWARLVVITRIFGMDIHGHKTDGLVPYADMLNHKRPPETRWTFDNQQDGFTIVTTKTVPFGAEVYDSYGRKCNSRYFVNYGFTLEENKSDNEVVISIGLPRSDPHYVQKLNLQGNYGERDIQREFQIPATYREAKTVALFSWVRFVNAHDEAELAPFFQSPNRIRKTAPVSVENEIATLRHLAVASQAVLDGFETTIEEDEKILAQPPNSLDPNYRNCVVMRRGEKQVLHWFIDLSKRCIPLLRMPWSKLKNVVATSYFEQTTEDEYIVDCVIPLVKG